MGVILMSLVLASVALPLLTKGLTFAPPAQASSEEGNARRAIADAAIRRLEQTCAAMPGKDAQKPLRTEAANSLIDSYRARLASGETTTEEAEQQQRLDAFMKSLRLEALHAERDELYRLRLAGELDDVVHLRLLREIDLAEASLEYR